MRHKGNRIDVFGCWAQRLCWVVLLTLPSCSTVGFYTQALKGQAEILRKAKPVETVLAAPQTSPRLKEKLRLTQDLRAYAKEVLSLPADAQYDRYSDLGRRYVVWVVFAAPEFSVEGKTWWYPLLGNLEYRGFFTEKAAQQEADKQRAQGLDVYVGGVEAYSTLGFLRDPLLNTFMGRDDAGLAELVFHELTHQRLYLPGDTDFNEALATAVGQEGTRRWFRDRGRLSDLRQYEKEMKVEQEFITEVLQTREELKVTYQKHAGDRPRLAIEKKAAFERLRARLNAMNRRYGGSLKLDRWFQKPVNNARLNTLSTYYDLLPGFEGMLRHCRGDLEMFYREVEALKGLNKQARRDRVMSFSKS